MPSVKKDGGEVSLFCLYDELRDPVGLVPNPRNPNKHPAGQVELLARIIDAHGWRQPITVSERSGYIVRGHCRREAAIRLGLKQVPVEVQFYNTEAEEWADLVADNRIAELADTDTLLLQGIMDDLKRLDYDLDLTGYSADDLQALIVEAGAGAQEDDFDVDQAEEAITEPVTKPGDLILLGEHRLVCGDSTDPVTMSRLMDGTKARMIFTDPPYNVDLGGKHSVAESLQRAAKKTGGKPKMRRRDIVNDKMTPADWEAFCKRIYAQFKEHNAGDVYMWGAPGPDGMTMRRLLIESGCHWSATIVWKKNSIIMGLANYQRMYEPCFYGWYGKSSWNGSRTESEVWEYNKPSQSKLHPTMKPVELCARGIVNSSKPGDIILDMFLGSGSVLIACEQLKRKCYGVEISPVYCDVIVQRWEELTKKKAVRKHGKPKEANGKQAGEQAQE